MNKKLLLFTQSLSVQTASTALANAQADAPTRPARSLLMIHDRTRDADLRITRKLLAVMLALRRPWVTETLKGLQALGYIVSKPDRDGYRPQRIGFCGERLLWSGRSRV
ncbi:helix-turn-helix domain-containing protein [Candidatus Phyllobacterium onerii]|uniref:helix-turn-helix domain-containing protein n=1 Tax=Candidatus Phyllobacterium onerii TaxID=3020828 RepID=UPI002330725D|nr:helix-turn-helix domain-containing protein [Phyllobacterium sp. IY22]